MSGEPMRGQPVPRESHEQASLWPAQLMVSAAHSVPRPAHDNPNLSMESSFPDQPSQCPNQTIPSAAQPSTCPDLTAHSLDHTRPDATQPMPTTS